MSSRWYFSAWLLVLEVFALRKTQAVHHRHELQFTTVGTDHSVLELSVISLIDDVKVASYKKGQKQITIKIPWISEVLGVNYVTQLHDLLVNHEQDFLWPIQYLARNDINKHRNCTVQLLAECEIDNDITVKSHIYLIWNGKESYRIDEEVGHWENIKPETKQYQYILESPLWTSLRKHYMNLRDNVAPEMAVSQHVSPEDSIILSCIATGFYPHSILMPWEKNGDLGIWGNESSSGTLPNMDSTFYLKVTLELPPEDTGAGYSCVVEHRELKSPAMYSAKKPTMNKPWILALGIMLAVILLLICATGIVTVKIIK
uniref:Ig-like domain-containing protein n=1 Tax=Monodelphis domestica TaxID=13616 RepID=A0A5F8H034_MONDO